MTWTARHATVDVAYPEVVPGVGATLEVCYPVGAETTDESTNAPAVSSPSKSPRGSSVPGCLSNFRANPRGFLAPLGGQRG